MTNNWQTKRLDEISTVTMGQSPASSSYNDQGLGVPFFQGKPSNIDNFGVANPYQYTTEPTKVVEAGTALMTVRAPVGDIFTSPVDVCIGRGLSGIKANAGVSQKYLNYQLQFASQQFHTLSQGSTFTAINSSDLKGVQVGMPNLTTQQKIGDILSSIDEAIQKTDQIIQKSEQLKNGLMNELLSKGIGHKNFKKTKLGEIPEEWEIDSIDSLFEFINGYAFYRDGYSDVGFRVIDLLNIDTDGIFQLTNKDKFVSEVVYNSHMKQHLYEGDLIIIMTDITPGKKLLGKTSIIQESNKYILNQRVGCLRNKSRTRIITEFARFYINSELMHKRFVSVALGSAQFYINTPHVKDSLLPIPSVAEQKKIVSLLSDAETKIQNELKYKNNLCFLKKGLMHDIFNQKVQIN